MWLFVLEESVSLTEAVGRLLLAGLMCAATALCASALRFLIGSGQKVKQVSVLLNLFDFLDLEEVNMGFKAIVLLVLHPLPASTIEMSRN